jgi:hypothetical protein
VVKADDTTSVTLAETCEDWQDGEVRCLPGRNLTDFDYVSVGRDSFIPVNTKPTIMTWLGNKST